MSTVVNELVDAIRSGPSGPEVAAVFDFDGTLIDGYSAGALYSHRIRNFEIGPDEMVRTLLAAVGGPLTEADFTTLMERGIKGWTGRTEDELLELGEQLYYDDIGGALFHDAWRLVRAHQNQGHTVVIATSATRLQVAATARELGIDNILCTELDCEGGVITGHVRGRALWGDGKIAAVAAFAAENDVDLSISHAYANGDEDVPLLAAVGQPHPVNPQPLLAEHADRNGWTPLQMKKRQGGLDPRPAIRTAAMFGTLFAAAGTGLAAGLLTRNRRRGVDIATSMFGDVASILGNIDITVSGEHNAWSHRPAVFFINHQSTLIDLLVTTRVLRRGFTAVAKAEVRDMPIVGTIFDAAGFAFVDRSSTSKAISALAPVVAALQAGTSMVMAPEGTRSMSPRVGRFKKGGLHMAVEAQVPIVPIVIRNAGEIMWRNAKTAQEGTIEVVVHQPLPTIGWGKAEIDLWTPRLRQLYVDTLDDWPGDVAAKQWSESIAESSNGNS